jgi:hypothetical protein
LSVAFTHAAGQQPRKGFIMDLGLGIATTNTTVSVDGTDGDPERNTALGTIFKIGYAPSDQVLIYYDGSGALFRPSYADEADLALAASGLSGIGASVFLSPVAPSAYFHAVIGQGVWAEIYDDGSADGYTGRGFAVGGGYEFAAHWLVDLTVAVTRPKHDRGSFTETYKTTTWTLGLIWLLY